MITNRKGRAGWHQATPRPFDFIWKYKGLAFRFKAVIVTQDMWLLLTLTFTAGFASQGGLCNV